MNKWKSVSKKLIKSELETTSRIYRCGLNRTAKSVERIVDPVLFEISLSLFHAIQHSVQGKFDV